MPNVTGRVATVPEAEAHQFGIQFPLNCRVRRQVECLQAAVHGLAEKVPLFLAATWSDDAQEQAAFTIHLDQSHVLREAVLSQSQHLSGGFQPTASQKESAG